MPIYEYDCAACATPFEELVAASGSDRVACPACGSTRVERRLSSFQRVRAGVGAGAAAAPARSGGGCCGGGCGCGH